MLEPKFIKTEPPFSDKANLKEEMYRNEIQLSERKYSTIDKWKRFTQCGVLRIIPHLIQRGISFKGKILGIGAGGCWLSSELSKIDKVEEIYPIDFSKVILKQIAPHIMHYLDADISKITCIIGDFHTLKFDDKTFDFVVCDTTLHHTNHLRALLNEIVRVLKDDGMLIALREPILSKWRFLAKYQKDRFGIKEKRFGVIENIYGLEEWRDFFSSSGFKVRFIPYIHHTTIKGKIVRFSFLRFLNGHLFSKYIFIARKNFPE